MSYRINLRPEGEVGGWRAEVEFKHNRPDLAGNLAGIRLHDDQAMDQRGVTAMLGAGLLDDEFGDRIAAMVRSFIESITPIVNDLDNEDTAGKNV